MPYSVTFLTTTTAATTSTDTTLDSAITGVTNIAEALSKYGPVIVICSIFIVLFVLIFLLFMKVNSTMIKNMINQANQQYEESKKITDKLLQHFLDDEDNNDEDKKEKDKDKKNEEKPKSKDLVGMFIDYNTAFKRESKAVINKLRCERVAVYVFHNGNKTLYGLPFIKMTCVHESTIKGAKTIRGNTHSNLPLHLFNELIEALYRNDEFAGNINDVEIHDNSINEFLAYSESKSLFIRGIKKEDGSLAGFTVCEFNTEMNFADKEVYNNIKFALKDMNTAIRYIVTDEDFSHKYENHNEEIKTEE